MPAKDSTQVTLASSNAHTSAANADACLQATVSGVAQSADTAVSVLEARAGFAFVIAW